MLGGPTGRAFGSLGSGTMGTSTVRSLGTLGTSTIRTIGTVGTLGTFRAVAA
jgi:hypothetical protein